MTKILLFFIFFYKKKLGGVWFSSTIKSIKSENKSMNMANYIDHTTLAQSILSTVMDPELI